jgi:phage terminase large subunit-like protein
LANGHYYVLGDYSLAASPLVWASEVVKAYHIHHADRIIGEVNNGGDLIETTLRTIDPTVSYRKVTATRGKAIRAEPIAALYEQGKVHHVGAFQDLEDQMCEWVPNDPKAKSPDRMDALVWAITDLMQHGKMSYSIIGGERR